MNVKHMMTDTRLHNIWTNMRMRCNNQNDKSYRRYGGRGITICDEWANKKTGFMSFYDWAIENGYSDNLSIDRINNDGNYEPSNCRWATAELQQLNKSVNGTRNKTGHVGITKHKNGRYYPSIKFKNKRIALGGFLSIGEAVNARNEAKHKYWNEVIL